MIARNSCCSSLSLASPLLVTESSPGPINEARGLADSSTSGLLTSIHSTGVPHRPEPSFTESRLAGLEPRATCVTVLGFLLL